MFPYYRMHCIPGVHECGMPARQYRSLTFAALPAVMTPNRAANVSERYRELQLSMKTPRHIEFMPTRLICVLLFLCQVLTASPLPPLACPAGGPIGSVDLRVSSPRRKHADPLPLKTIKRVEEAD